MNLIVNDLVLKARPTVDLIGHQHLAEQFLTGIV